jgi:uncharacterized membrane protein YedE/YeeE
MSIVLAIVLGSLFGFVMNRSGVTSENIINMLRLKDLRMAKFILFAIGFSSLLLFVLLALGIVDSSHISVKTAYVGVIVGGMIFGLGWAISGFCPGTGITAAGSGSKDALFYILGGLVGAGLFTAVYSLIQGSFLYEKIAGRKVTTAIASSKFDALITASPLVVAGIIAIAFMAMAWFAPVPKNTK